MAHGVIGGDRHSGPCPSQGAAEISDVAPELPSGEDDGARQLLGGA